MIYISIPHPHLSSQAPNLLHSEQPACVCKNQIILCTNRAAENMHINPGMHIQTAKNIFPSLLVYQASQQRMENLRQKFLNLFQNPQYIHEPVTGTAAYVDDEFLKSEEEKDVFKKQLFDEIKKLGVTAKIGSGSSKLVAKLAADVLPIDGMLHVPAKREKDFIQTLPISFLPGIGRRTARVLRGMGIRAIADFAKLSGSYVYKLFGKKGEELLAFSHAKDVRILKPLSQPTSFSFTHPVSLSQISHAASLLTLSHFFSFKLLHIIAPLLGPTAFRATIKIFGENGQSKQQTIHITQENTQSIQHAIFLSISKITYALSESPTKIIIRCASEKKRAKKTRNLKMKQYEQQNTFVSKFAFNSSPLPIPFSQAMQVSA